MKNCFGACFFVLLSFLVGSSSAVQPAVTSASAYLADRQDRDGIWRRGTDSMLLDSYAAVMALRQCPDAESNPALWSGVAGLLLALAECPGWEENLVSALTTAAAAGSATPALFQPWADAAKGGWGMEIGARADLIATVLVLELLLDLSNWGEYRDQPEVQASASYLLNAMTPDGWWQLGGRSSPGDFRLGCRIAGVLAELSNRSLVALPTLPDALSRLGDRIAQHWQREGDRGYYDDAVALRTLCRLGRWQDALPIYATLRESQDQDGGWRDFPEMTDDIQTTAAAMTAMAAFQLTTPPVSPDLFVTADGVTVRQRIADDGTKEWQVQALVFNQGNGVAKSFQVNFYAGTAMPECLLAQADVSQIRPGRSVQIGCRLTKEELPSWLVVAVDVDGRTPDQNRENNLCYCFVREASNHDAPEPAALALLGGELLLNGEKADEIILLANRQVAILSGSDVARGCSGSVEYVFSDNGDVIASGNVDDGQGNAMTLETEWFPKAGQHALTLSVKAVADGQIIHADAVLQVTVVDEGAMLQTWQFVQNAWQKSVIFQAREYVEVETMSADPEAEVTLWMEDADGAFQGTLVASPERPGRHHWHTGTRQPGEYRACALFRQKQSGALLAEVSAPFTIAPTETFFNLVLTGVSREHILACGQTAVLGVGAQWQALVNIPGATCCLTWCWEHEDGQPVDGWPEISREAPVALETLTQRTNTPETMQIAFAAPGMYRLAVLLSVSDQVLLRDYVSFQAVARPVPVVENRVVPEFVQAGAEQVATIIRLRVVDAAADLLPGEPASFATGDFSPFLDDAPGVEVAVPLLDIRDRQGVLVASGALASRVDYGRTQGDGDLAPGRAEGAVTLHLINQGEAELSYAPTGNTLTDEKESTVVIAIHQVRTTENGWQLGRQIGSLEVYLTGVKQ